MNGLKFIRTRCNYSQAALAEMLNVSRQAINMWETSKKPIPEPRRTEICEIFGIENSAWLDEIDEKTANEIIESVMYKVVDETGDDSSEHFLFKPVSKYNAKIGQHQNSLSLDDICSLKRLEVKKLFNEIDDFSKGNGVKNSYGRLWRMNMTTRVFQGVLDAMNACLKQPIVEKMVFVYMVFAVIDAMNLAFGNVSKDDILNLTEQRGKGKAYYTPPISIELAEIIRKRLDENLAEVREGAEKAKAQIKAGEINPIPTTNP